MTNKQKIRHSKETVRALVMHEGEQRLKSEYNPVR
jgi:hypothetical protein